MVRASELLRMAGFDPEAIEIVCKTYVKSRRPVCDISKPDPINEMIALRILSLVRHGERNVDQLCAHCPSSLLIEMTHKAEWNQKTDD